jgi:hypothetical protein
MSGYAGYQSPQDTRTDYDAQHFLIEQLINRLATTALVRVVAVTSAGAVAPVGTVDVVPMVHQVDGVGDPTPHATIFNVPYFRAQGGADAIIIDPKVGDVGIAVFCSRDITGVKRSTTPTTVEITAPQTTINGNLTVVGTMLNNGHAVGSTHRHLNSGGTGTGGVPE